MDDEEKKQAYIDRHAKFKIFDRVTHADQGSTVFMVAQAPYLNIKNDEFEIGYTLQRLLPYPEIATKKVHQWASESRLTLYKGADHG